MNPINDTLAWHNAVQTASPVQLTLVDRVKLALRLIADEEVPELVAELVEIKHLLLTHQQDTPEFKQRKANAAKEAADVLFVILQAMHTLDIPFEMVYAAVLKSNWDKLKDGPQFRNDGKLLKPAGYQPPDIEALLL